MIPHSYGKIPWRREQLHTPEFWPGEFHGQSLAGYSPWGHRVRYYDLYFHKMWNNTVHIE